MIISSVAAFFLLKTTCLAAGNNDATVNNNNNSPPPSCINFPPEGNDYPGNFSGNVDSQEACIEACKGLDWPESIPFLPAHLNRTLVYNLNDNEQQQQQQQQEEVVVYTECKCNFQAWNLCQDYTTDAEGVGADYVPVTCTGVGLGQKDTILNDYEVVAFCWALYPHDDMYSWMGDDNTNTFERELSCISSSTGSGRKVACYDPPESSSRGRGGRVVVALATSVSVLLALVFSI